ncbi:RNA polymerase sigma factor [Pedobacter sp. L105]|uniref:RNA polymerase sigma factor n=1 Tax=Pedobacter sp. L105 TaxID=1641871 RepID=UPI00131D47CE|nr:RNA polymerase sigma factor [Pedobacter sp. L105]
MLSFLLPLGDFHEKIYPKANDSAEAALVNGLLAGEKQALEKLYACYAASLLGIISKIIKQQDVAEDVLQETFLKIWKSIAQYDAGKGRLFTWMARLAKNKAIDHLRTRGEVNNLKNDDLDDFTFQVNQLHHIEYHPEFLDLRQLIKTLTPMQTVIIDMVYFQGYTQAEVSEALDIPIGTVKTRIRKGIQTMRTFF